LEKKILHHPNIGPAAARPAGPVATALDHNVGLECFLSILPKCLLLLLYMHISFIFHKVM